MSKTVTFNLGASFAGENVASEEAVVCDGVEVLAIDVAGSTSNGKFECQWDKDTIKCLSLKADGGAVTIKTNSSGSPDDTIALDANEVYIFTPNVGSNVFDAANVTALYLTTSTDSTTLRGIIGFDYQP